MPQPVGHLEKVRAIAISGRLLVLGGTRTGSASQLTFWDFVGEKPERTIDLPAHVLGLTVAEGSLAAACADGLVRLYAMPSGKPLREIQAHSAGAAAVAMTKELLVTAGHDGALRSFSLKDGKLQKEWALSSRPLRSLSVDPTGELFAAAGDDGVVQVVWPKTGERRAMEGHEGAVFSLAFTPSDGRLASGGEDGTLRLWYLVGEVEADVRGKDDSGHVGGVTAILFPPAKVPTETGDRVLTAGRDGRVRFWRVTDRRRPRALEGDREALQALAFAPSTKAQAQTTGVLYASGEGRSVIAFEFDAEGNPPDRGSRLQHGFQVLAEALKAPAGAKRRAAVRTLAALEEPEALELAQTALRSDSDPEVRALAATELADQKRRLARKALRDQLNDDSAVVRRAVFGALRVLEPDQPLSPLRAALDSPHPDLRIAALEALPPLFSSSPLVAGLIASRLSDSQAKVRQAALAQLVSLFPPANVEPLRTAFERGREDVRAEVLVRGVCSKLLADPVFKALVGKALDDENVEVRRLAFVVSTLPRPLLFSWLEAKDEGFARTLTDLLRRALELEGTTGEPTAEQLAAMKKRLFPPSAAQSLPEEADREPLLAALACRTPDTALRGARGLALLGDLRALGALLTLSRDPVPTLRSEAASALVALEDPRARRRLEWMLSDPNAEVRESALRCLGRLDSDPLRQAQSALRSAQEDIRVRGLDALVKQGKKRGEAEALLYESLEDESPKVRGEAFRTLWAWQEAEPLVPIDRALLARFPDVRLRAVKELRALAEKSDAPFREPALERLCTAVGDRDATVGRGAYEARLAILGKADVEALLKALGSPQAAVRAQGARDCAKAPADKVRPALSKLLEDHEESVRTAAIEALDKLLPDEVGPLTAGLQSSFLDLRVRAAELLAERREDRLIDPLRALLADKELIARLGPKAVALRQRSATALASLGSPRLLKYFATELIKDEDPIVREQASRGVANASRRGEEGYLLDLLGHEDIAIRSWAGEGLARLGDVRALPVLTGTLRHDHPPLRIGAVLSFAALGPEGYGGLLQGLEDASREVQRIVLSILLARDLRAFRRGEPPDLLASALSSARPEIRFAAARALELRTIPEYYVAHLIEVLRPERPENAEDQAQGPEESVQTRLLVALAEALAGDRPEQRYAAAQALRLRDRPIEFFREVQRATRPRTVASPWIPETTPRAPAEKEGPRKPPLALLRRLFAAGPEADESSSEPKLEPVSAEEQRRLELLAFGAYVGLLRQEEGAGDEGHRVRRDAIDRVVGLTQAGTVSVASATPALARALDDPNHLVRRAAFVGLKKVYGNDLDTPLTLALASSAADSVRAALEELAAGGEQGRSRIAIALNSPVAEARKHAFELLEKLSPKGSLEPLLAALGSDHADLRIGVLERLATFQDARVQAALGKALESDHDDLRLRAAEMLAARKDDRAVDALAGWLRAEDAAVVERAQEALVKLGSEAAVKAFAARLEDGVEVAQRLALVRSLSRLRVQAAVQVLATRFQDEEEAVRKEAFEGCLALVGPRSDHKPERGAPRPKPRNAVWAESFLRSAVQSRYADRRLAAAQELDDLEASAADSLLVGLFADRDLNVRKAAVTSYAKRVKDKNALPAPLEEVLRAGARELMLSAAEGLAHKSDSAAFRPLLLFVRAGEAGERERALLGLGVLGDKRALAELETIAQGGTEEAPAEPSQQAAALEALGSLYARLDDDEARERVRDRIEAGLAKRGSDLAIAAVKALGHLKGERARSRIEGVLSSANTEQERKVAAETLGELADQAAEKSLATALGDWSEDVRWAAREALDKLFPNERTRVELHAVESEHDDLNEPAAAFLASEGEAAQLLAKLAKLESDELRARLRFGLVRRDKLPAQDLVKLLKDGAPTSRGDAAWLIGARASRTGPEDRATVADALATAARKAEEGWLQLTVTGKIEERAVEQQAWVRALWASNRLGSTALVGEARRILADVRFPRDVREEAAALLAEDRQSKEGLVAALSDREMGVRRAAAAALCKHEPEVLALPTKPFDPVLLGRLRGEGAVAASDLASAQGRRLQVPMLVKTGTVEGLVEVARKGMGEDQKAAIAALGLMKTEAARGALRALRQSGESPEIKKAAYRALRRAERAAGRTREESRS